MVKSNTNNAMKTKGIRPRDHKWACTDDEGTTFTFRRKADAWDRADVCNAEHIGIVYWVRLATPEEIADGIAAAKKWNEIAARRASA